MIKSLKSNRIYSIFVIIFMLIFISNPKLYMQSTLKGLTVWFYNVIPALLPFFIATRLLISLNIADIPCLDKISSKLFKVAKNSKVFLLSLISGYPVGAKLICSSYTNGEISLKDAKKMMSYCSVSGPMFIIGSIGIGVFNSVKIGYILLISHILGAIINGMVFRNSYKNEKDEFNAFKNTTIKSNNILADSMLDSIMSILLVGGYIVFAFVLIELLNNIRLIPFLATVITKLFPFLDYSTLQALFNGLIEMTCGVISLNIANASLQIKVILASFVIAFGGLSIFLQSTNFTKDLQIKKSYFLFQKFCQGIWTLAFCSILTLLI